MKRGISTLAVLALVVVACSPETDSTATTVNAVQSSTSTTGTIGVPTTTTTETVTTTTIAQTTTTQTDVDAEAIVMAKTGAVEAALPEGWTFTTGPTEEVDTDDFSYEPCLLENDFDLDNLDAFSDAALVTDFEGLADNPPFPGPMGGIEARVFESEAAAAGAFGVFERIFGSEEGLECMTGLMVGFVGDDVPAENMTFSFEELTVEGSQAGARFELSFDVSGFTGGILVEFQGALMGSCTVIASFITFGDPLDRDVADTLFSAAVNA
jgi:hypothetical protein